MAEDNFKKFKKRYESGEIKTMAMPPIAPGPTGLGRMLIGAAARYGVDKAKSAIEAASKSSKSAKPAGKSGSKAAGKTAGKAASKGRSGTLFERLEGARTRIRTEKEANKFGPLVKRQENLPAVRGSRAIVKREDRMPAKIERGNREVVVAREGKKDLQPYNAGNRSVATTGTRTFGDKGQSGRIVGLSPKGKLAAAGLGLGLGAAGYAGYKKAAPAGADEPRANVGMRAVEKKEAPRDDRASSKGGMSADQFRKGMQGRAGVNVVTGKKVGTPAKSTGKAGDKSRLAGKMTNFERMKARQYEKEGYGGRSMTAEKAKAQVAKDRSYKFSDLFKKKK